MYKIQVKVIDMLPAADNYGINVQSEFGLMLFEDEMFLAYQSHADSEIISFVKCVSDTGGNHNNCFSSRK